MFLSLRLKTKSFKNGKVGVAAFMGSPTVGNEKVTSGREIVEALECIEKILKINENNKKRNINVTFLS